MIFFHRDHRRSTAYNIVLWQAANERRRVSIDSDDTVEVTVTGELCDELTDRELRRLWRKDNVKIKIHRKGNLVG